MTHLSTYTCSVCNKEKQITKDWRTGCIESPDGEKICFDCCGAIEADELHHLDFDTTLCMHVKQVNEREIYITNWPETLKIPVAGYILGKYNFIGRRADYYFKFRGNCYKAKKVGDTSMAHVRRIKAIPEHFN